MRCQAEAPAARVQQTQHQGYNRHHSVDRQQLPSAQPEEERRPDAPILATRGHNLASVPPSTQPHIGPQAYAPLQLRMYSATHAGALGWR
jgi:hypothetical protein